MNVTIVVSKRATVQHPAGRFAPIVELSIEDDYHVDTNYTEGLLENPRTVYLA